MFYQLFKILETQKYISYTAIILLPEARILLLKKLNEIIPVPWEIHCDHMTINMGEASEGPAVEFLGKKVSLKAVAYAISEKALAVEVETEVPSKNKIKHITIATSATGRPGDSNDLTNWKHIPEFFLYGTVEEVEIEGEAPKPKVFVPPTPPSPDSPEDFVKFLKNKPLKVIQMALKNKFPGAFFSDEQITNWLK